MSPARREKPALDERERLDRRRQSMRGSRPDAVSVVARWGPPAQRSASPASSTTTGRLWPAGAGPRLRHRTLSELLGALVYAARPLVAVAGDALRWHIELVRLNDGAHDGAERVRAMHFGKRGLQGGQAPFQSAHGFGPPSAPAGTWRPQRDGRASADDEGLDASAEGGLGLVFLPLQLSAEDRHAAQRRRFTPAGCRPTMGMTRAMLRSTGAAASSASSRRCSPAKLWPLMLAPRSQRLGAATITPHSMHHCGRMRAAYRSTGKSSRGGRTHRKPPDSGLVQVGVGDRPQDLRHVEPGGNVKPPALQVRQPRAQVEPQQLGEQRCKVREVCVSTATARCPRPPVVARHLRSGRARLAPIQHDRLVGEEAPAVVRGCRCRSTRCAGADPPVPARSAAASADSSCPMRPDHLVPSAARSRSSVGTGTPHWPPPLSLRSSHRRLFIGAGSLR
jgi:hypothetical protein